MSFKVLSVETKDKKHITVTLTLLVDDKPKKFVISERTYRNIGCPLRSDTVDPEAMSVIKDEDECRRALSRALSLLSYADNNQRSLRRKLRMGGFSSHATEEAIAEVLRLGYVDEEAQVMRKIQQLANRSLLGPARIRAKLRSSGYSGSLVDGCLCESQRTGEVDFSSVKDKLIEKHSPKTFEERQKLLYKYGFGTND